MKYVGSKTTILVKQQSRCGYKNNIGTKTTAYSKITAIEKCNFHVTNAERPLRTTPKQALR